jgi:hypothetical protein
MVHNVAQFEGAVFMVDQQPVEPGAAGQFGNRGVRQTQPQTVQWTPFGEGLFKTIAR